MLQVDGATLVAEDDKAEAAFNYFSGILAWPREGLLDFEALGIHRRELSSLVVYSPKRKFGRSSKSYPLITRLGLTGSRAAFVALPGRSSNGIYRLL
jgi:hypothetical protein